MIGFVYLWVNKINDKKYIGVHVGQENDGYIGSGVYFKRAIEKYGLEKFERIILYREYENKETLYEMEFTIINDHNAVYDEEYYNLSNYSPKQKFKTNGKRTRIVLESTKKSISISKKDRKWVHKFIGDKKVNRMVYNPELFFDDDWILGLGPQSEIHKQKIRDSLPDMSGEKNPFYGKKHSDETKQKIRDSLPNQVGEKNPFYGKKHSDETKQKIRDSLPDMSGEKNPFYGKKHSDETKKRASEAKKNKIFINDGEKSKTIDKKELDYYLNIGWKISRLNNIKQLGKIMITNEIETIMIDPKEMDNYLEIGYRRGRKKK